VSVETAATVDGPARRRETPWSLKTIVEDVAGRPITEFQDPSKPVHPYLKVKLNGGALAYASAGVHPPADRLGDNPPSDEADPIDRVYPPLSGATGRWLHGPEGEHHHATLSQFAGPAESPVPGVRPHAPGPSRRPERIYLHYLLLHIDRLSDTALNYLLRAVEEEVTHRQKGLAASPPAGP
jgi:hypothetical protein